ncbi:MAG TPA: alpha/beta hydrolase-fold protein [Thermoanaerobaculia bacterium]|nr:alpha/beta hydrolase-fold protein [Thermoanaerobaculia bacterium]
MKRMKSVLTLGAVAVLSIAATLLALEVFRDEPPVEGAIRQTTRSRLLGEEREYFVHLPEGYDSNPSQKYPVMVVLDGTSQSEHTAASAALMARIGLIPPTIVIAVPSVDGETRNRDYTPPDMRLDHDDPDSSMGSADRFLAHLERELIPEIDRKYRTARPRAIAGWSRGGLFVVYTQIEKPALFDAAFADSPALWRQEDRIVTRLERAFSASPPPEGFLFLSLGEAENDKMTSSFRHAVQVLERSAPPALRWRSYVSVKGTHESNPRLAMPVGLCALFRPEGSCGAVPAGSEQMHASAPQLR